MADDERADRGNGLDALADLFAAALQLDRVAVGFLDEAAGVLNGGFVGDLIGHVGHVADDEGVRRAAAHGGAVVDHVVHRDGDRGVVPERDHADRVADEDHVHSGAFLILGRQIIVGREPGDRLPLLRHAAQVQNASFHVLLPPVIIDYFNSYYLASACSLL